jgi:hypothetical protein
MSGNSNLDNPIAEYYLKPKLHIYLEYHSACPLVGIGTPHTLSHKRVCPPSLSQKKGEDIYLPAGEEVGESQFGRLENTPV